MAQTSSDVDILLKGTICTIINGFPETEMNVLHRWNRSTDPKSGIIDEVHKPQYFHSAVAIYIFLKYPKFRPKVSFMNIITKHNLETEFLKIAMDVIGADEDGVKFMEHSDILLQQAILVDEKNGRTIIA